MPIAFDQWFPLLSGQCLGVYLKLFKEMTHDSFFRKWLVDKAVNALIAGVRHPLLAAVGADHHHEGFPDSVFH